MINLGQIFLSLAVAISAIQFFSGVFQVNFSRERLTKASFALVLMAFIFLVNRYCVSDFSYLNVFENSHTTKPLIYKISGVWGNHEGSMLLFALILSAYSLCFAVFSKDDQNKEDVLLYQGLISFLILSYVFFFSDPFEKINPELIKMAGGVIAEGKGLNPLLQDFGLALHPPILYLGYAGFSVIFSYAIVAMRKKVEPQIFAENIRVYSLVSWSFLGAGIALGSWWAYRELGWGGFWFWDPVENSSLVPWLISSALLHSAIYTRKFGGYTMLTVFLALNSFIFALVGFFLVRSGILSSVHSFAADPNRGIVMLVIVAILSGYSMYLYGKNIYAYFKPSNYRYSLFSRQIHISLNVVLFLSLTVTILLGLFYPLILQILDINSISVGEPYFEKVFLPLSGLLAFVAIFTPFVKWHDNKVSKLLKILPSFVVSVIVLLGVNFYYSKSFGLFSISMIFVGLWLFISMLELYILRIFDKNGKVTRGLNVLFLSHGGFGLLIVFITLLVNLESADEAVISKVQPLKLEAGGRVSFNSAEISKGDNYLFHKVSFDVLDEFDVKLASLNPENRVYFPDLKKTYEVDVKFDGVSDYYMVMGASDDAKDPDKYEVPVRFYIKPFMMYVWLAMAMVALGGFVALYPRKK